MSRRSYVGCFFAFCLVLGFAAPRVLSQAVYGSIIGTITDQQGAAVAGAKVTVTSATKSTSQETTSNESGNYTVTHLAPDVYNIKVEGQGFKAYEIKGIQVFADAAAHVDAKLELGAVTQSIEVTGEIPQLKTDRSDVAVTFNSRYVENLPILNNNFTNFLLLSPGTQKLVGWSHAATENPQGSQQIFVNGQHFSGTAYELDGTDNQDPILGIIVVNPNIQAITETKIAMQNYDAEFGKAVAGIVTVQTKSGTNDFHGSGFYDYRGSGQQARDPFTNAPGVALPNATWKQFGGALGGPIIKDKLFFFGDYQGTRQTAGITNQLTTPTAEVLSTCNPATNAMSDTPGYCNLSAYTSQISSGGGLIYNPASSAALDGSGRTAFCGPAGCATEPNWIPIGMISTQAAAVLADFPAPTSSGVTNNFVGSGSGPFSQNSFDIRADYAAPHGYQVFGRYSQDYYSLSGLGTLGVLGGVGFGPGGLNGESNVHNYSIASGFDKAIGTTWLTDFRFGYFKYNPQTAYSDASQEVMNGFNIPGLNMGTSDTGGTSSFFLDGNGGFSAFGDGLNVGRCNCPLTESEQQFQFVNNWTKIKGNHQIKFGADIRYAMNLRVPSDANRTGQLHFDSGGTSNGGAGGLSLATFLLGDVTQFERFVSSSLDAAERQKRWFFYGQDTWRVTSKLTFNYGLRWEIYFPETVNGKGNGGFADLNAGVIKVAGYGPIGLNGNVENTYKAFAPRLGIAYQVDPKTVVRVGYGRSFDIGVFGSNFGHVVTQNLPVLAQQQLQDSNTIPGSTNGRLSVFTLAQGPPAFDFSTILGAISPEGTLPLLGPTGTVNPRIRPNIQRLQTLDAWNASIQRAVTSSMSVTLTYIGNKGTHLMPSNGPSYNNNEVRIGDGMNVVTCSAAINPCPAGDVTLGGFQATLAPDLRRNYPQFPLDLGYFGNDASSSYNAIQVEVDKRWSSGLQFIAHYTFSHSKAYDTTQPGYSYDPRIAYGPDQFTRNHVFVASTVYDLPFGKGRMYMSNVSRAVDYLIGGWQISNTLNWSSGLPWTATIGECGSISDAGACRPNLVPGQSFSVGPRKINGQWYEFTPAAPLTYALTPGNVGTDSCTLARPTDGPFSLPACGTVGNAGVFSFTGPRAFFDDMGLSKSFSITERVKAAFRFDAYNVFNHPVLGFSSTQGNTCVDCGGNAGQITDIEADASPGSPNGMRQLQFGVRLTF